MSARTRTPHVRPLPRLAPGTWFEPGSPYGPIADELKGHLAAAGAKGVGREALMHIIMRAHIEYLFEIKDAADKAYVDALGGVVLIERAIELLKHEDWGFLVLKGGYARDNVYDDLAEEWAKEKYQILLNTLAAIAKRMRDIPRLHTVKRGQGRPPKQDLDCVIDLLADFWEWAVGPGSFTAKWTKGERKPATHAAAFVRDVVKYIDPARLLEVPKAMERVIKERNKRSSS
jgi:hypothetical protein